MDPKAGESLDLVSSIAADTTKIALSSSFLMNLFFIGSLSQLLSMIQNLSFIVHM